MMSAWVSLLCAPFLLLVLCVVALASLGRSLGVRRLYVHLLLKLFEYGRQHIEVAKQLKQLDSDECVDDESQKFEGQGVILREALLAPDKGLERPANINCNGNNASDVNKNNFSEISPVENELTPSPSDFDLSSCLDYVKAGVESIIEDQVTSVFEAEELRSWNLLTRTNRHYEFVSWRLTVIWVMGFFVRYFFLLPLRIFICCVAILWMIVTFALVGKLKPGPIKNFIGDICYRIGFRIMARSLSCVITIHNVEHMPKEGFCVANHTSPIDIIIMSTETCFSLIGQRHGGFLGLLQRALARASPHIWFERSEVKDRHAVTNRLKEHVSDPNNPPILIFPEGTCINNTSVMQFKKGSFEVGGVIYPVAIKYDPKFGDAFWNSSKFSMMQYLYMMMTSWAIVCDVWYLPPMYQRANETAVEFANRVKSVIALQGGLVDLVWDGQLKRMKAKKEWKELQQEEFSRRLKGE